MDGYEELGIIQAALNALKSLFGNVPLGDKKQRKNAFFFLFRSDRSKTPFDTDENGNLNGQYTLAHTVWHAAERFRVDELGGADLSDMNSSKKTVQ